MSIGIYAVGYREADDEWRVMKEIWDACERANVEKPAQVEKYFDGIDPGNRPGAEVSLGDACQRYKVEWGDGYQIDVTKLPPRLRYIRVYYSS